VTILPSASNCLAYEYYLPDVGIHELRGTGRLGGVLPIEGEVDDDLELGVEAGVAWQVVEDPDQTQLSPHIGGYLAVRPWFDQVGLVFEVASGFAPGQGSQEVDFHRISFVALDLGAAVRF
jgi:hypothetical protein